MDWTGKLSSIILIYYWSNSEWDSKAAEKQIVSRVTFDATDDNMHHEAGD